ncbi:hormogonium polysaccharide biosynthesis protein HpsA [Trichocoleus sp. ST-U3]
MSTRKKPSNFIQRLFKSIWRFFNAITKTFISWLLRSSLGRQGRRRSNQAGFVLPTVVMVVLVVTLLTTAILLRSFDRSKNASNYRVNEVVLNAAAPALDRSRAKLNRLFSSAETELPGNTPADDDIADVFEDDEYTFGDETPLKLVADLDNPPNGIQPDEVDERLRTAWKFPVDTDNDGFFDSFTLYGVYFRVPPDPNVAGGSQRARGFLEARTRPQDTGASNVCLAGGGAAGDEGNGWYQISGQLKKAFFTYVATVPITPQQKTELDASGYKNNLIPGSKFKAYVGNKGFSALEMQQDQARLALDNNAVWYEDDLIITDVPDQGGGFKLNGRVQANSNLMLGSTFGDITFYQVSSPWSCFYEAENGKIVVGGNVSANGIAGDTNPENQGNDKVKVHLFKEPSQPYDIPGNTRAVNTGNVTTNSPPRDVAYNANAYAQRLNVLVTGAMAKYDDAYSGQAPTVARVGSVNEFPPEIAQNFEDKYPTDTTLALSDDEASNLLEQVITVYFKERIRRVPYAEVPIDEPELALNGVDATTVFAGGGTIKAPQAWMDVDNLNTDPLSLKVNELEQTKPTNAEIENEIGDRILVGNGLPVRWLTNYAEPTYAEPKAKQPGAGNYTDGSARVRESQAKILDDLGDTSRNGFWEKAAADPNNVPGDEELAGGLRVVTGAGIYIDSVPPTQGGTGRRLSEAQLPLLARSFLPTPPVTPTQLQALNAEIPSAPFPVNVVWPDTMPMYQEIDVNTTPTVFKGDLQMRATVVYHYTDGDEPIACISSYYDPTNSITAQNSDIVDATNGIPEGRSNNGINYAPPSALGRAITPTLRRQAYMVFPDGRWANEPLKNAIDALQGGTPATDLSLEQKAAIDAANCALTILDAPNAPVPGSVVPDGAIRERAFLDARQVKTLHKPDVEFDANGLTFQTTNTPILRETTQVDADGKVLIADPELLKIATQETLNSPVNPKNPTPAEYSLPIEERQPLEIRVTEIDLEQLRTTAHNTNPAGETEYLLPLSGIIYASRDDALPDITDVDLITGEDGGSSATDFKADPSRRPNGIRLWSSGNNGGRLSRGTDNDDSASEKGLILASNLPVYIKGDFNRHYEFGTTTVTEEFNAPLAADYGNFYTRGNSGTDETNPNFACRNNSNPDCDPGDQWRAARVLSDAITLLSNNFRDGFREEGNYDFNNNAGNLAVAARLKNGFWWNGFGTNYVYRDGSGGVQPYPINDGTTSNTEFPAQDLLTQGSSYVMNGVTPIQRRANFPEYKMEICRTLPVSECVPNGSLKWDLTGAGTTVADPNPANNLANPRNVAPDDQRFPRRVAFERDPNFGQLVLSTTTNPPSAQPKRPTGAFNPIPYSPTASLPNSEDNALWFWTTSDNANPSAFDPNSSYNNTGLLYYLPDDEEDNVATERQMLLPGTPKFPPELATINAAFDGSSVLNGTTDSDPSDYSVCIRNTALKTYKVSSFGGGNCPVFPAIRQMWQALTSTSLVDTPDISDPTVPKVKVTTSFDPAVTPSVTAEAKVNVLDLAGNTITGSLTLSRGTQSDPIFIIRGTSTGIMDLTNVVLTLEGVDPNNIFWVARRDMRITSDATARLAGNFIGGPFGRIRIQGAEGGNSIKGGRILGFGRTTGGGSQLVAGTTMTALTTTAQPLLVPVLQLHSPEGEPSGNINTAFLSSSDTPGERKWLQRAVNTDYNAVLVMGDTPARPYAAPNEGGENNGGLHNFPRFIENWTGSTATIKGSLIQYIKSKYATGPFDTVDLVDQDNSLFFDDSTTGELPDYIDGSDPNVSPLGYQYPEASARFKAPFYQPPTRAWGYDVGLLSQTPDLFSRRIALPEAGTPNEFFREVARDDPWVQGLLCAAEKTAPNAITYKWALADPLQRPTACQAGAPGTAYND